MSPLARLLLAIVAAIIAPSANALLAQDEQKDAATTVKDAAALLDTIKAIEERKKTLKFGVSVGYRRLMGSEKELARDVSLNPVDNVVHVGEMDHGAMVISGVVVAFPWKPPENECICRGPVWRSWRFGFLANVNLATFADAGEKTFNQSVEGGIGIAYRINTDFALALTFERVFARRLREFVVVGQPLPVAPGDTVDQLLPGDDRYFRDDNLSALSLKFVYFMR